MSVDLIDNEKLMHLITCPICLDVYCDPRMLPCQHTFCKGCLERIAEDRWNRCPQCRKSFRIPFNGGINSFDVNRIIVQLIETMPKKVATDLPKQPMLRAKCGQCRRDDIIAVCEHCREAICKTCRCLHFKDFKDDIHAKIKKLTKDSDVVLFKEIESISNHEKNIQTCVKTKETIQRKIADIIKKLKDDESKLLNEINEFERSECTAMADNSDRVKELNEINSYCESIMTNLDRKTETDKDVIEVKLNCDMYAKKVKDFLKDLTNRMAHNKIEFFDSINTNCVDECFSLGHVEICCATTRPSNGLAYENEIKQETLEMQLKQITKANQLNLTVRRSNNSREVPSAAPTTVPIKLTTNKIQSKSVIDVKKFFQNHKIIGHEGSEVGDFRHPLGLAVSPINGNIYVADSWNNRIQIFTETGGYLKSIDRPENAELHYPYSIHIDKTGHVYVTDQSLIRIKVFNADFKFVRSIGKYGRTSGCFSGLCDVTTDDRNNIYVCDSGNHCVLKYAENGDYITQWGKSGALNGEFKCPACITVHLDRIIVSDWGNHRVQIFNLDGEFVKSIGAYGSGAGEFKRPLGIAADDSGNIAIVDEGNNRVQIFKADLTFYSKVNGLKCNFQRPWDIAITKTGQFVVSEYYGHCLQIF